MTSAVQYTPTGALLGQSDYSYDAINRRIETVEGALTAFFGYDGLNPSLKLSGTGSVISRRLFARTLDSALADESADGVRWFLADQQGTSRDLISNAGTSFNHYAYDSFGRAELLSNPGIVNDLQYTNREFSQQGSSVGYFRSRFYDAALGRLLQEDPVEDFGYAYVRNQPLTLTDPTGEELSEESILDAQISVGLRARLLLEAEEASAATARKCVVNALQQVFLYIGFAYFSEVPTTPPPLPPRGRPSITCLIK